MVSQEERTNRTRGALIDAALGLFLERGYAGVATEEIAHRAGVTRGALYHHFPAKLDLLDAVVDRMEDELAQMFAARVAAVEDPYEGLLDGLRAVLEACTDPAASRLAMVEAPTVLGWGRWRELEMRYSLGLLTAALDRAMTAGRLRTQPVKPLAHVLLAAMIELGLLIANAEDRQTARQEADDLVSLLMSALQTPASTELTEKP